MILKILFVSLVLVKAHVDAVAWDYNDFNAWGLVNPVCNSGRRQTPINIVKKDVIEDPEMHHIQAVNYNLNRTGTYKLKNTGYGVKATPMITTPGSDVHPYVVHNHVSYILDSFHFHWGRNDSEGSEHTVDGKMYPAELHFVHYNRKYPNISAAVEQPDGLLVRGIMFVVDPKYNNTELMPIIDAIPSIRYEGNETSIAYLPPQKYFPKNWQPYFNYPGSLTTPGCFETVNWFVHQEVAKISSYQLQQLRMMYSDKDGNTTTTRIWRPVQSLNGRQIKSRKVDKSFVTLTVPDWDHTSSDKGTSKWPSLFPYCADNLPTSRQSPININSTATKYNKALDPLKTTGYSSTSGTKLRLSNNGHAISVTMVTGEFPSTVTHKGHTYQLHSYHFHWSDDVRNGGSEHTYDGKQFFAEIHFVHFNKKYKNIGEAMTKSDGLLVWGHFIQALNGSSDHAAYKKLTDNFVNIQYKGQHHDINYIPNMDLIPPNSNHYYTYPGSLTTPHCFESVTWIVNRDIIDISIEQAQTFLAIYETKQGDPQKLLVHTWRPAQNLNGRTVETNFFEDSNSSATGLNSSIAFLTALFFFVFTL